MLFCSCQPNSKESESFQGQPSVYTLELVLVAYTSDTKEQKAKWPKTLEILRDSQNKCLLKGLENQYKFSHMKGKDIFLDEEKVYQLSVPSEGFEVGVSVRIKISQNSIIHEYADYFINSDFKFVEGAIEY